MKVLEKHESNKIKSYRMQKSRNYAPTTLQLLALEPGQSVLITQAEWKLKTDPVKFVHSSMNNQRSGLGGIRFSGRKIEGGWIIERL